MIVFKILGKLLAMNRKNNTSQGRNKKIIEEYIKNQIQEDIAYEQMSLKEYIDPFTGEPVNKGKK